MPKFTKVKYSENLLGSKVTVITNGSAKQRGFEVNKAYEGKLLDKKDWSDGCPVLEGESGKLG